MFVSHQSLKNPMKFKPNQEGLYERPENDFENSEYLSNLPGENGQGVFGGVYAKVRFEFDVYRFENSRVFKDTEENLKKYGYDAGISKLISLGRFFDFHSLNH